MRAPARLVLALVVSVALLCAPILAQELTAEQRATLEARVETFSEAAKANDVAVMLEVVPPRILERLAEELGMSPKGLISMAADEAEQALATVTLIDFSMDIAASETRYLPDGMPYLLIPTEMVMDVGDAGTLRKRTSTLALLDGGTWYLVRLEEPQQNLILIQVYPGFSGVEFPTGSMEAVTE